jgi:hypothetical protein
MSSSDIIVSNVVFQDSPFWNIHPVYCRWAAQFCLPTSDQNLKVFLIPYACLQRGNHWITHESRTRQRWCTAIFLPFFLQSTCFVPLATWGCLVPTQKNFTPSRQMFGHMYGVLNVDEKNLIAQFGWKSWDESFKPN